jgi:hypothetical protein
MTAPAQLELPPTPPRPPRDVTGAVRRRSVLEPRVRFWWLAGLVLLVLSLYLIVDGTLNWSEDLSIVRHGTPVTATVSAVGEGEVSGRANLSPEYPVTLEFQFEGVDYVVKGHLDGRTEPISLKDSIPIKVDPANPKHWTYLTTAPPIGPVFLSAGLVAPFALAALTISWVLRARIMRVWRTGQANPFIVETTLQTALAPRSRAVRCRAVEGRTKRLVQVFVPRHLGTPKPGDVLWLIHPAGNPTVVLAAMNYV